ncbi:hypothetical protein B0H12DRAFT_1107830 [Mycena haematopus]|nr:hypothetical protein B0H12DRAFT_1107830 [Mycena haematopus]
MPNLKYQAFLLVMIKLPFVPFLPSICGLLFIGSPTNLLGLFVSFLRGPSPSWNSPAVSIQESFWLSDVVSEYRPSTCDACCILHDRETRIVRGQLLRQSMVISP